MRMLVCLLLLMAMPTLRERATAQEAVPDTIVYEVVEKWPEGPVGPKGALSYEQQKEQQKLIRRLEKAVADCEARIEKFEADIASLEEQMATPEGAADMALYEKHTALKKQLDTVVEEWETASLELEEAMG